MKVLADVPFCCCMPWRLRDPDKQMHGAWCFKCDMEIAAPEEARGKRVACIYCGMDEGWIPAIEIPPDGYEESHPTSALTIGRCTSKR